jgi:hypothetical protein
MLHLLLLLLLLQLTLLQRHLLLLLLLLLRAALHHSACDAAQLKPVAMPQGSRAARLPAWLTDEVAIQHSAVQAASISLSIEDSDGIQEGTVYIREYEGGP